MNKKPEHIDDNLLLRFLSGETNEEENLQIDEWLQQSEENQELLDNYEAVWAETGKLIPKPVAVDTPSVWGKMSERIDQYEKEKDSSKTISLKTRFAKASYSIAAAVIIMFGIYQLVIKPSLKIENITLASTKEILHDTLPDGSRIALNENTQIVYPEEFATNERQVKLKGEAYFNVKPNKEKPFVIETSKGFVKVLGTSFNVKAYENGNLEVMVTEGLVQLYSINKETMDTSAIILKAGEKGQISSDKFKPVYVAEHTPDAIFWMDYTLIFNDTDLKRVFSLLENYYNVKITVNNKDIYNCHLSTTFNNNSIVDIIEVIITTFGLEFVKEENTYILKGNGCSEETH